MAECVFCDIIRGDASCYRVHEDADLMVFMDIFPVSPGHTLIVPKQHATDLFEMSESSAEAVARTARRLAHAIRSTLAPDGLMVIQLNGAAAGQTVFHYHMHLLPRAHGAPMTLHTRVPGDPTELADTARRLAQAFGEPIGPTENPMGATGWRDS